MTYDLLTFKKTWIMLNLLGNESLLLRSIYRSPTVNNDNMSKLLREVSSSDKHKANLDGGYGRFQSSSIEWDPMSHP